MDQPGVLTSLPEDFLDPFLLAEIASSDELDRQTVVPRQPFSVVADFVTEGFGEPGVVEESNPATPKLERHRICEADL